VTAACTGDNAQYDDLDACVAYCDAAAPLPLGTDGDTSGNSVACRAYHASVAADDAATHCPHAGPSGANVCGTWCENYCHLALGSCTGDHELYANQSACDTACAALGSGGAAGDMAGDSVQCRIYHLGVAGGDPGTTDGIHCPHGSADGGGECVSDEPVPTAPTYNADVQPILKKHCGGCHAGGSETGCSGGTCLASHYGATQLDSYYCGGDTKGACALARSQDGSMPLGNPGALSADDEAVLTDWIAGGQLE
jgi:hypothetical protein